MTKAEERALEFYPMKDYNKEPNYIHSCDSKMLDEVYRQVFMLGYKQAEKDLALTWEDMRKIILIDIEMTDDPEAHPEWMEEQPFYEEILKRYLEAKK
jgi:hypothetical protein